MDFRTAGDAPVHIRILFVCLGNICRSPLAEGVFRHQVEQAGLAKRFEIRSAGTGGWHVGGPADERMTATARRYGVALDRHCASQLRQDDLARYDHIFVMDKQNLFDVLALDEGDAFGYKVRLFREFDPEPDTFQVPDPYYGGPDGFDEVYRIVDRTARNLLNRLIDEHNLQPLSLGGSPPAQER